MNRYILEVVEPTEPPARLRKRKLRDRFIVVTAPDISIGNSISHNNKTYSIDRNIQWPCRLDEVLGSLVPDNGEFATFVEKQYIYHDVFLDHMEKLAGSGSDTNIIGLKRPLTIAEVENKPFYRELVPPLLLNETKTLLFGLIDHAYQYNMSIYFNFLCGIAAYCVLKSGIAWIADTDGMGTIHKFLKQKYKDICKPGQIDDTTRTLDQDPDFKLNTIFSYLDFFSFSDKGEDCNPAICDAYKDDTKGILFKQDSALVNPCYVSCRKRRIVKTIQDLFRGSVDDDLDVTRGFIVDADDKTILSNLLFMVIEMKRETDTARKHIIEIMQCFEYDDATSLENPRHVSCRKRQIVKTIQDTFKDSVDCGFTVDVDDKTILSNLLLMAFAVGPNRSQLQMETTHEQIIELIQSFEDDDKLARLFYPCSIFMNKHRFRGRSSSYETVLSHLLIFTHKLEKDSKAVDEYLNLLDTLDIKKIYDNADRKRQHQIFHIFRSACYLGNQDVVSYFFGKFCNANQFEFDITQTDEYHTNILHTLCLSQYNVVHIWRQILEKITQQQFIKLMVTISRDRYTAFHAACQFRNYEIIECIINTEKNRSFISREGLVILLHIGLMDGGVLHTLCNGVYDRVLRDNQDYDQQVLGEVHEEEQQHHDDGTVIIRNFNDVDVEDETETISYGSENEYSDELEQKRHDDDVNFRNDLESNTQVKILKLILDKLSLVEARKLIKVKNSGNTNVLSIACSTSENASIVRLIMIKCNITDINDELLNTPDNYGRTALNIALQSRIPEIKRIIRRMTNS